MRGSCLFSESCRRAGSAARGTGGLTEPSPFMEPPEPAREMAPHAGWVVARSALWWQWTEMETGAIVPPSHCCMLPRPVVLPLSVPGDAAHQAPVPIPQSATVSKPPQDSIHTSLVVVVVVVRWYHFPTKPPVPPDLPVRTSFLPVSPRSSKATIPRGGRGAPGPAAGRGRCHPGEGGRSFSHHDRAKMPHRGREHHGRCRGGGTPPVPAGKS